MARRRTIGGKLLRLSRAQRKTAQRNRREDSTRRGGVRPVAVKSVISVRATFHLPAKLVEDAKNAVVALSGPPMRLTLAALVRSAVARELARLQKTHNKGKPWPQRSAPLIGGRPLKA
jgi:hypothetical protein